MPTLDEINDDDNDIDSVASGDTGDDDNDSSGSSSSSSSTSSSSGAGISNPHLTDKEEELSPEERVEARGVSETGDSSDDDPSDIPISQREPSDSEEFLTEEEAPPHFTDEERLQTPKERLSPQTGGARPGLTTEETQRQLDRREAASSKGASSEVEEFVRETELAEEQIRKARLEKQQTGQVSQDRREQVNKQIKEAEQSRQEVRNLIENRERRKNNTQAKQTSETQAANRKSSQEIILRNNIESTTTQELENDPVTEAAQDIVQTGVETLQSTSALNNDPFEGDPAKTEAELQREDISSIVRTENIEAAQEFLSNTFQPGQTSTDSTTGIRNGETVRDPAVFGEPVPTVQQPDTEETSENNELTGVGFVDDTVEGLAGDLEATGDVVFADEEDIERGPEPGTKTAIIEPETPEELQPQQEEEEERASITQFSAADVGSTFFSRRGTDLLVSAVPGGRTPGQVVEEDVEAANRRGDEPITPRIDVETRFDTATNKQLFRTRTGRTTTNREILGGNFRPEQETNIEQGSIVRGGIEGAQSPLGLLGAGALASRGLSAAGPVTRTAGEAAGGFLTGLGAQTATRQIGAGQTFEAGVTVTELGLVGGGTRLAGRTVPGAQGALSTGRSARLKLRDLSRDTSDFIRGDLGFKTRDTIRVREGGRPRSDIEQNVRSSDEIEGANIRRLIQREDGQQLVQADIPGATGDTRITFVREPRTRRGVAKEKISEATENFLEPGVILGGPAAPAAGLMKTSRPRTSGPTKTRTRTDTTRSNSRNIDINPANFVGAPATATSTFQAPRQKQKQKEKEKQEEEDDDTVEIIDIDERLAKMQALERIQSLKPAQTEFLPEPGSSNNSAREEPKQPDRNRPFFAGTSSTPDTNQSPGFDDASTELQDAFSGEENIQDEAQQPRSVVNQGTGQSTRESQEQFEELFETQEPLQRQKKQQKNRGRRLGVPEIGFEPLQEPKDDINDVNRPFQRQPDVGSVILGTSETVEPEEFEDRQDEVFTGTEPRPILTIEENSEEDENLFLF